MEIGLEPKKLVTTLLWIIATGLLALIVRQGSAALLHYVQFE